MAQSDAALNAASVLADLWAPITPDAVWEGRTGRGVRVAVVDSGMDDKHPALKDHVKGSVEAVVQGGKISFPPSTSGDAAGHGTACAGIILDVAPGVDLYSVKVLGANASGSGDMFLAGLDCGIKQKMQVVNLSLGTTKPKYFAPVHDLIDRAYPAGCIVVAAANNLPQPSFPSVFSSSLLSVIKSEQTDPLKFGFRCGE